MIIHTVKHNKYFYTVYKYTSNKLKQKIKSL